MPDANMGWLTLAIAWQSGRTPKLRTAVLPSPDPVLPDRLGAREPATGILSSQEGHLLAIHQSLGLMLRVLAQSPQKEPCAAVKFKSPTI